MNAKSTCVVVACLQFICAAYAYEPISHQDMSERAVGKSVLSDASTLQRMGFSSDIASIGFSNSQGQSQTIVQLIRFGADWEDNRGPLQAPRHFYNPVDGSKLLPLIGETSPDWALEDRGVKDGHPYSYRLMRGNFHKALTALNKPDRDAAWGLTFQILGHVMHHIQDMAQPQHVRGDAHCDAPYPCLVTGSALGFFSPSIYEMQSQQQLPLWRGV